MQLVRSTLVLWLVVSAVPAGATTLLHMTDEAMAVQADAIVQGHVEGVQSVRLDGDLVTRVAVRLDDVLKGDALREVTVVVPGGVDTSLKHPVATVYPGAPQFFPGQDVVLFLDRLQASADGFGVVGFSQGAFAVVESPSGEKLVSRDLRGVRFQDDAVAPRAAQRVQSLDAFKRQIRGYLEADAQQHRLVP